MRTVKITKLPWYFDQKKLSCYFWYLLTSTYQKIYFLFQVFHGACINGLIYQWTVTLHQAINIPVYCHPASCRWLNAKRYGDSYIMINNTPTAWSHRLDLVLDLGITFFNIVNYHVVCHYVSPTSLQHMNMWTHDPLSVVTCHTSKLWNNDLLYRRVI